MLALNKARSVSAAINIDTNWSSADEKDNDMVSDLMTTNQQKPSKSRKSVKLVNNDKKKKKTIDRKKRRNSESIKRKTTKTENDPINKPIKSKPKKRRNSTKPSSKSFLKPSSHKFNTQETGTRKSVKIDRPKRRHSVAVNPIKSKQPKQIKKSRKHSVSTICRKSSPKTKSKPTKPRKNKIIKKDDIISAMKSTKKHKRSRSKSKSISSISERSQQILKSKEETDTLSISYPYNYKGIKCQNIEEIGDALRRNEWKIGSNVLISEKYYGRREWIHGMITNIHPKDDNILIVTYLDRKQRREDRFSKYLKVCWNDESEQEITKRVMAHFGVGNDVFSIGQFVQFDEAKLGKIWCQIMDIQRDEIKMRYLENTDGIVSEYKNVTVKKSDKIKGFLSNDLVQKLGQKWLNLNNRFCNYSDRKLAKIKDQRCMHFNSMRDLFSDCPNSYGHKVRIERMNKIIKSNVVGNIQLFPMLILNFDNILSPQLVQFAMNQKDEKKLKMIETFMYKAAELMTEIMDKFNGKVLLITNHSYVKWYDLVMNMPAICGGDWWRNLCLKMVENESKITLFSLKNVSNEGYGCAALEILLKQYLLSVYVDIFRRDGKKDIYYVPVVFSVDNGEWTNDVNQAMKAVIGDYYRLIDYECDEIQIRDGDMLRLINEDVVIKSLIKMRDSSGLRPFVKSCSDIMRFKEKTWEGLFIGGHGCMLQKYILNEDDMIY